MYNISSELVGFCRRCNKTFFDGSQFYCRSLTKREC